jgi:hypothetical protein
MHMMSSGSATSGSMKDSSGAAPNDTTKKKMTPP